MKLDDINVILDGAEQFALSINMLKRLVLEQQQRLLVMSIESEKDERSLIQLKHQIDGMKALVNLYEKEYAKARKTVSKMP